MGCSGSTAAKAVDLVEGTKADKAPVEQKDDLFVQESKTGDDGVSFGAREANKISINTAKVSKRMSLYGRAKRLRRKGVSAESEQKRKERKVGSIVFDEEDIVLPTFYKDPETTDRIKVALKTHFLFANLEDTLFTKLVECMEKEKFGPQQIILKQGTEASKEDKMYLIDEGEVEVFIESGNKGSGEVHQSFTIVEGIDENSDQFKPQVKKRSRFKSQLIQINTGKTKVAEKASGEIFGDIALLFAGPRTASVYSKGNCTVYALNRKAFTKLLVQSAGGTQSIRFLREIPLLHTLSDNTLGELSNLMILEKYDDGQVVIEAGGVGDSLLIIESGYVAVAKDMPDGSRKEVMRYGRGEFIGERSLMTGKIRTADCYAVGDVQILKLMKDDFLVMKPLIYDVIKDHLIFTVMQEMPETEALTEDQIESCIDLFDEEKFYEGDTVWTPGDEVDKLYIIESGELEREEGGTTTSLLSFDFFGEKSLHATQTPTSSIRAKSDTTVFAMHRDDFVEKYGDLKTLVESNSLMSKLQKSPALSVLSENELESLQSDFSKEAFKEGTHIIRQGETGDKFYILFSGEAVVTKEMDTGEIVEVVRLKEGDQFGERALLFSDTRAANVIASKDNTVVLSLTREQFEAKLGSLKDIMEAEVQSQEERAKEVKIRYSDLEIAKVLGSGQFGAVSVAKHRFTSQLYALKKIPKSMVISLGQFDHVENERDVMVRVISPFLVRLFRGFHDYENLYMVLELVPGGELFHLLDMEGRFNEQATRFFAASVILGLRALHSQGIVYRDLKPENLLLDADGYLKICDFGFAKQVGSGKTFTFCGTPDYQAPEIIKRVGHSYAADYWALGVLIYELLVGDAPFCPDDDDPRGTYKNILQGALKIPTWISNQAADIISKLLTQAPEKRLGCGRNGIKEIMAHPWFRGFDWTKLERRKMVPPIKPEMSHKFDLSNFEEVEDDSEYTRLAIRKDQKLIDKCLNDQKLWANWDSIDAE